MSEKSSEELCLGTLVIVSYRGLKHSQASPHNWPFPFVFTVVLLIVACNFPSEHLFAFIYDVTILCWDMLVIFFRGLKQ